MKPRRKKHAPGKEPLLNISTIQASLLGSAAQQQASRDMTEESRYWSVRAALAQAEVISAHFCSTGQASCRHAHQQLHGGRQEHLACPLMQIQLEVVGPSPS